MAKERANLSGALVDKVSFMASRENTDPLQYNYISAVVISS